MTAIAGDRLTVVMYHFVQPAGAGPMPGLAHLDIGAFREQLAYIRRHYSLVSPAEVMQSIVDHALLPPRPALLTFDDGYRCHHRDVVPLLEGESIPALFFPVAASTLDRCVLDVNKIQCILAATRDASALVATVERAIDSAYGDTDVPPLDQLRARYWTRSRWDPEPVVYVKRLLQHALPDSVRRPLVDDLFAKRVTADERSFADELYMTVDELQQLRASGMTVGAHGDRHLRLSTLSGEEQAREIDGALRVLDAVGAPRDRFAYCYASGDHDERSVALLRARGCVVAFTTRPDLARVTPANALALPRLDTNDLPMGASEPANEWTRRAGEPS